MLHGEVGAGKSHFARALIRAILPKARQHDDIPSPTFTLVQSYEAADKTPIWHGDLYRLNSSDEVHELGLAQAFDTAITLIEWPEKLGDDLPARRLDVTLAQSRIAEDARTITLTPSGDGWDWLAALQEDRAALRTQFLTQAGWQDATQIPITSDASNRAYTRLAKSTQTAILMDAPPARNEDTRPFLAIAAYLRNRGYSAPQSLAQDPAHGFLLLEDLGDDLFASLIAKNPAQEPKLYQAAIDLLVDLQSQPAEPNLPPYSRAIYHRESRLLLDFYAKRPDLQDAFRDALNAALAQLSNTPPVTILRDYHAENLLWLPDRAGHKRVGLLDFQDALQGHPAYDLVSLLEDARRDVSPDLAQAMMQSFAAQTGTPLSVMQTDCAILGAQRNAKILGLFTRLAEQSGKRQYLALIPRVLAHFRRDLSHPALNQMRALLSNALPQEFDA